MENEVHIGRLLTSLAHNINRKIGKDLAEYDITTIQGKILGFLYVHSGKKDIFQKNIEEEFNIRRSSVTSVLQLMEKNGYIQRVSVVEDARLKKIVLTERGVDTYNKVYNSILKVERSLVEELSEEERDTLISLIGRLSKKVAD